MASGVYCVYKARGRELHVLMINQSVNHATSELGRNRCIILRSYLNCKYDLFSSFIYFSSLQIQASISELRSLEALKLSSFGIG